MMSLRSLASVLLTVFVGSFVGYLIPKLGAGLPPAAQWQPILMCALLAGVAAVAHLFQDPGTRTQIQSAIAAEVARALASLDPNGRAPIPPAPAPATVVNVAAIPAPTPAASPSLAALPAEKPTPLPPVKS